MWGKIDDFSGVSLNVLNAEKERGKREREREV
jgi:hypothetical protein